MASVIHHEKLVGFGRDGLQELGHLTIGDGARLAAIMCQQGFDTPALFGVVESRAMAGVVNENTVTLLNLLVQLPKKFHEDE